MLAVVEALSVDERGVLMGLLAGGGVVGWPANRLAGAMGSRCLAAARALAELPDPERAAELDALRVTVGAAVPEGLERAHPGWLRQAFQGEASATVAAIARDLPEGPRRVADELLRSRGDAMGAGSVPEAVVVALRRTAFAALAPMPGPGLSLDDLDRRGAELLGLALVGAPAEAVARAAAGVGEPLARVVLASALGGAAAARDVARALVAAVPAGEARRGLARAVGLRALAGQLAERSPAARAAAAQALPPDVGQALLALLTGEA